MTLLDLLGQVVLALSVTAGFGILFNVPRKTLALCAGIGAIGHIMRYSLRTLGVTNEMATFCGALTVGLIGYWAARRTHLPRLIYTVTGIISMVPGIPAYEMIIYFSRNQIVDGLQSAVRAGLVAAAIAIGLSTARLLTEIDLNAGQ